MDIRLKGILDNWVHFKTRVMEFETLFSDQEDIRDLRNNLLPDFFEELNGFYWENFLITIARLLDDHKQGQNQNLTLFTLLEILKEENKDYTEIELYLNGLKAKYKDIIIYRRKYLAHYDLDYSVGEKEFNTSTHIDQVQEFINSMILLINMTLQSLGQLKVSESVIYPGKYLGAQAFIRILKNEKESRIKKLNMGK